jgi:hypothetical protein
VGFPPVNSLDSGYLAHRNDLEGRAALASQLSEDRPQAPGTPGAAPAAGAGDRVSDLTLSQLITGRRAASAAAVPPAADEWEWRDPLTGATASEAARGGEQIEAGARDVGRGVQETSRWVYGSGPIVEGVRKSLQATLDGAQDLGDWMDSLAIRKAEAEGQIQGAESPSEFRARILKAQTEGSTRDLIRDVMGDSPRLHAQTVTGGLVEAASQFITSMATLRV